MRISWGATSAMLIGTWAQPNHIGNTLGEACVMCREPESLRLGRTKNLRDERSTTTQHSLYSCDFHSKAFISSPSQVLNNAQLSIYFLQSHSNGAAWSNCVQCRPTASRRHRATLQLTLCTEQTASKRKVRLGNSRMWLGLIIAINNRDFSLTSLIQ